MTGVVVGVFVPCVLELRARLPVVTCGMVQGLVALAVLTLIQK